MAVCTRGRVNGAFTNYQKRNGGALARKKLGRWDDVTELLGCSVAEAWGKKF